MGLARLRRPPGTPASPEQQRLPLLPLGPDGVHASSLHGTQQPTQRCHPHPGCTLVRRGRDLNPRGFCPTSFPGPRTRPDYATSPQCRPHCSPGPANCKKKSRLALAGLRWRSGLQLRLFHRLHRRASVQEVKVASCIGLGHVVQKQLAVAPVVPRFGRGPARATTGQIRLRHL